jgi:general secretion pathway protein A
VNNDSPRGPAFYEHFFRFHRPPFSLAPDTRFRFQSASHAAAMTQITYALERREPIIVVIGEIGTGKTLLCRTIVEQTDRKTFVSVINDPQLDGDELLKRMLEDFGVLSKDRTRMTPTSRHDLVHALQEFLASLKPIHAHAAVIIDEAHHMQPEVLEQIRLVSNIEDERGTLLQIILLGQTDLEHVMAQPSLRQLSQRVSRFVRLEPLSSDELTHYIHHRLGVARARPVPANFPGARELERELAEWDSAEADFPFTQDAVSAVGRISRGIPRVVNLLCDRALEAAYASQLATADTPQIKAAAESLGLATDAQPTAAPSLRLRPDLERTETRADESSAISVPQTGRYALIAALLALAAVAVWFGMRGLGQPSTPEPASQVQAAPPQPAPHPQAVPPAAAPAREPATPSATPATTPLAATPSAAAPAPASAPPATGTAPSSAAAGDRFEIVVASFRTAARATDVATAISALPEPVRQRSAGGWEQVIAGPYASADLAREAQQRLERAGFTGIHISPAAR